MDIDYAKMLQEICAELGYNEDEFDSGNEIHNGIKKLESKPEEEIARIIQALWDVLDKEWENILNGYVAFDFTDIYKLFHGRYFETFPDEQKRWDEENGWLDDEAFDKFFKFMRNQPDYEEIVATKGMIEGGVYDFFIEVVVRKVSEDIDLPYEIIEVIRNINGIGL